MLSIEFLNFIFYYFIHVHFPISLIVVDFFSLWFYFRFEWVFYWTLSTFRNVFMMFYAQFSNQFRKPRTMFIFFSYSFLSVCALCLTWCVKWSTKITVSRTLCNENYSSIGSERCLCIPTKNMHKFEIFTSVI